MKELNKNETKILVTILKKEIGLLTKEKLNIEKRLNTYKNDTYWQMLKKDCLNKIKKITKIISIYEY